MAGDLCTANSSPHPNLNHIEMDEARSGRSFDAYRMTTPNVPPSIPKVAEVNSDGKTNMEPVIEFKFSILKVQAQGM